MIKKQTTSEWNYNNVESHCMMKCNHTIYTTQHGKKKNCTVLYLRGSKAEVEKSSFIVEQAKFIPGVSYLSFFSVSTWILLSLLFHSFKLIFVFLLHRGCRKNSIFFFQNKHYSKASATPRVKRFSVFCMAWIWPLCPFTDGWSIAQGLLIGKYP